MRGLTIPRPVYVESIDDIEHIGKEVIVDPTETEEVLTAELLGETRVVQEYHDPAERIAKLKAEIRERGVSQVARVARVSPSTVRAFINQGAQLRAATIAKLEAVLTAKRRTRTDPAKFR